jgi:hypothetical protein
LFPKFFCKFEICLKFQTFPNIRKYPWTS